MRRRFLIGISMAPVLALLIAIPAELRAQDIPGIEICTAEKAMDRRTSCLQSNVDFLQKTMISAQTLRVCREGKPLTIWHTRPFGLGSCPCNAALRPVLIAWQGAVTLS